LASSRSFYRNPVPELPLSAGSNLLEPVMNRHSGRIAALQKQE
jgi:hypothetical protein